MEMLTACPMMMGIELVVNGHLDDPCISFCCYDIANKPQISLGNTSQETAQKIMDLIKSVHIACIAKETDIELDSILSGCKKCSLFKQKQYFYDGKIRFINLSMYPSPCQSNCIYCEIQKNPRMMLINKNDASKYDLLLDTLTILEKRGYILSDALWQLSPGEITIHPMKVKILNFLQSKRVIIYTNGFVLDKSILELISNNSKASMNISIDAGTEDTWRKIKGHDNFIKVQQNIEMYVKLSSPQQMNIKYIVLPGINDNNRDIIALISFLKKININTLVLSLNYDSDNMKQDIISIRKIIRILRNHGMQYTTDAAIRELV